MTNTLDKQDEKKTGGTLPPKPPNNGGGGDPWGDDPEGKPSLETYLALPASAQAAWYSKVLRHRILLQRLHLYETAEDLPKSLASVQGRTATEQDIRDEMAFLATHQQQTLQQADEWCANPSKFRLSMALALMYSGEYLTGDDERAHWFMDLTERIAKEEEEGR